MCSKVGTPPQPAAGSLQIRRARRILCALAGWAAGKSAALHSRGAFMSKMQWAIGAPALLLLAGAVHAQGNEFATGNMHFDAHEMDTNGDHMITRDEMIQYAQKQWDLMAKGKDTIPIAVAAKDFASGGVNFQSRA